jgi:hypothetical protein
MLLAATDIAVLLLIVELLPVITDLVIVYFLIVMVRLIVVWVGIWSFLRMLCAVGRAHLGRFPRRMSEESCTKHLGRIR